VVWIAASPIITLVTYQHSTWNGTVGYNPSVTMWKIILVVTFTEFTVSTSVYLRLSLNPSAPIPALLIAATINFAPK